MISINRVDAYTHFSSLKFITLAESVQNKPFVMSQQYGRLKTLLDWKERINLMDRNEVDIHVLVPVPWLEAFPAVASDRARASQAAQIMNDELAAFISNRPERFRGVAVLPVVDPDAMVRELHRAVKELGFIGAYCAVGPTAKRMDEPDMDALYQAIIEFDVTLWLHPSRPPLPDYADEPHSQFSEWTTIGWLHDTSSAMYRIVFSGVFDRYPGIRIIAHHHGAFVPVHAKRLDSQWTTAQFIGISFPTKISKPYIEHFRNFYCDTAAFGYAPKVLELALEFFGPERMLFGSDAPFDINGGEYFTTETLRSIDDMAITPEVRAAVLSKNAIRALRLTCPAA